ncbi:MAG: hypothetical protein QW035_02860 [Candidatus Anstonellales archaeon]
MPLLMQALAPPINEVTIAAFLLSFSIVVAYYLLDKAWEALRGGAGATSPFTIPAKREMNEFFVTVLIFAFFSILVFLMDTVVSAFVCGSTTGCNVIEIAHFYLIRLQALLVSQFTITYLTETVFGFFGYLGVGGKPDILSFVPFGYNLAPFAPLGLPTSLLLRIIDLIEMELGATVTKVILLYIISFAVPYHLLPLGFFMRAIPFTRKTGSMVIALCISAYFVYPFSVIYGTSLVVDYMNAESPSTLYQIYDATASMMGSFLNLFSGWTYNTEFFTSLNTNIKAWEGALQDYGNAITNPADPVGSREGGLATKYQLEYEDKLGAAASDPAYSIGIGVLGLFLSILARPLLVVELVTGFYRMVVVLGIYTALQFTGVVASTFFEIVLTITAFRAISELLSGEMALFGMGRLT